MSGYLPHTPEDVEAMLRTIGAGAVDDLFAHVPAGLRARASLDLPEGLTEPELRRALATLARRSTGTRAATFLGGGAYPHFVPAVVDQIIQRSEFATAYTPYQPEVSQGTLQSIFEFQTFTALLLGLDVANASMYDGASATAEAVLMARRILPQRRTVWLARALHPHYRAAVHTYTRGLGDVDVREVPFTADGRTDLEAMAGAVDEQTLCVVVGHPNAFGVLEDLPRVSAIAHKAGALAITATAEALALAIVRPPGASDVDIAVGEAQSFGLPVSYGGPGVGLLGTREQYVRSLPGRIVGETVDTQGRRGFVLTLATREQHIRRERATSNICTNQGLCALAVTAHLSLLGRVGLARLGALNFERAHAVARRLGEAGVPRALAGPFFNEFVVCAPAACANWEKLAVAGLVPGFPLARWYPELRDHLLVCVTEVQTAEEIDRLVDSLAPPRAASRQRAG